MLMFAVMTDIREATDDHRNIAKDNLAIAQKSLEIRREAHEQKLSERQAKCLQLFRLTKSTEDATYEWYKEHVESRVEGTCKWFLSHPHFEEWMRKESGPLLVSADPGCGKSVLAKYLIDCVLPKSSTVCYFFFKDQVQNTAREALCALLHQIFSQKPGLLAHATKQHEANGEGLVNSVHLLWTVFANAVQDPNAGSIIIVLDALDECAKSEITDLVRNIEINIQKCESSNAKLKLLMTSRPYEHVVSELYSLSEAFPRIRIPGEDKLEAISQEVNCVIRHRVVRFAKEKGLSAETKTCLEEQLLKVEHRTYLWAYLIFDYLKDFHFKQTPKGVVSALVALPTSVNQAYEQILGKSEDRLMVQKALAIILAATRPLTLSEMNVAMEVDEKTQSIDDLDFEPEEAFRRRLRSWCGLFVSVHHGKVYFLHQTAREFLLAKQLPSAAAPKELKWHGFTTMADSHTVLTECCVRFLSCLDNGRGLTSDREREFMNYSAKFWCLHLHSSSICDDGGAAVAPLTFDLSKQGTKMHSVWLGVYWRSQHRSDPEWPTSLAVACYFGHVAIAKKWLEKGADVNAQGGHYRNALQAASLQGHEQIVKLLIDGGADVNAQGGDYGNAFQAASLHGHEQIVKLLIDRGANVNAQGGYYGNALQAASLQGHEQIVKLLIDRGANVNAQGGHYGNALQAASLQGHEQIVKLLIDGGANVNTQGGDYGNALQAASLQGHEQIVKLLIDGGANINAQGGDYGNALQTASLQGHEQIVKLLIDGGADVNAQGGDYGNALQAASGGGYEQIVKLLIDGGANVNAQGGHYGNALQVASEGGYEQIVKLLINRGANVNAQGEHYGNALQAASEGGHEQIVKLLIDKGANVNAQGGYYENALQAASLRGHEQIVKLLIDRGADIGVQGGEYRNLASTCNSQGQQIESEEPEVQATQTRKRALHEEHSDMPVSNSTMSTTKKPKSKLS
ncbi:ankyrin repeat-containing domain protein [Phaeosphaeriaceae sp. PMI808]|nr:ankyrin repeat-containing domain protein [Phaeosphaeriaceae sp. PMI808]